MDLEPPDCHAVSRLAGGSGEIHDKDTLHIELYRELESLELKLFDQRQEVAALTEAKAACEASYARDVAELEGMLQQVATGRAELKVENAKLREENAELRITADQVVGATTKLKLEMGQLRCGIEQASQAPNRAEHERLLVDNARLRNENDKLRQETEVGVLGMVWTNVHKDVISAPASPPGSEVEPEIERCDSSSLSDRLSLSYRSGVSSR